MTVVSYRWSGVSADVWRDIIAYSVIPDFVRAEMRYNVNFLIGKKIDITRVKSYSYTYGDRGDKWWSFTMDSGKEIVFHDYYGNPNISVVGGGNVLYTEIIFLDDFEELWEWDNTRCPLCDHISTGSCIECLMAKTCVVEFKRAYGKKCAEYATTARLNYLSWLSAKIRSCFYNRKEFIDAIDEVDSYYKVSLS